jgi:hypothetical protein
LGLTSSPSGSNTRELAVLGNNLGQFLLDSTERYKGWLAPQEEGWFLRQPETFHAIGRHRS